MWRVKGLYQIYPNDFLDDTHLFCLKYFTLNEIQQMGKLSFLKSNTTIM